MKVTIFILLLLFSLTFSKRLVLNSVKLKTDKCKVDADCLERNFCKNGRCTHMGLLPISFNDMICFFLIIIASALSNAGGIGGGGLLIPILIFMLNFTTHEAIPITKIMIFSGAVISYFLNIYQKNPLREGITIDYNIALVIVPFLLFGTMVGVNLNRVLPPFVILLTLTCILSISCYATFVKYC